VNPEKMPTLTEPSPKHEASSINSEYPGFTLSLTIAYPNQKAHQKIFSITTDHITIVKITQN